MRMTPPPVAVWFEYWDDPDGNNQLFRCDALGRLDGGGGENWATCSDLWIGCHRMVRVLLVGAEPRALETEGNKHCSCRATDY